MVFRMLFFIQIFLCCAFVNLLQNPVKADKLAQASSNGTITDEMLRELLEYLRKLLPEEEDFEGKDIEYHDSFVTLSSTLSAISIGNLTSFKTVAAHSNMTTYQYNFKIEYDMLNLAGHYNLSLACPIIDAFGDGPFRATVETATLSLAFILDLSKGVILLKDVPVNFSLGKLNVHIDGIYGGGAANDAINQLINDSGPGLVGALKPYIQKYVKNQIFNLLSFLLNGMTMDDLVNYINYLINS